MDSITDAARAELLFASLRLRHLLDLAGGEFADPRDDELLSGALATFVAAADNYEAQADRLVRNVLGPTGLAAKRWGQ